MLGMSSWLHDATRRFSQPGWMRWACLSTWIVPVQGQPMRDVSTWSVPAERTANQLHPVPTRHDNQDRWRHTKVRLHQSVQWRPQPDYLPHQRRLSFPGTSWNESCLFIQVRSRRSVLIKHDMENLSTNGKWIKLMAKLEHLHDSNSLIDMDGDFSSCWSGYISGLGEQQHAPVRM